MSIIRIFLVIILTAAVTAHGQSTLDSFDPNANAFVWAIAVQSDGKILMVGDFTTLSPNGGPTVTRNRIARLNPDGTLDTAFNPNASSRVSSVVIQADGKILVSGTFHGANSIGGQTRNYFARLDPVTGAADSFDPNASSGIGPIALQPDGKILIGGSFSSVGGQPHKLIARLDPATGLADSFDTNPTGTSINAIAIQNDGKIIVGGSFSNIGGQTRNRIARLDPVTGVADSLDPNPNDYVRGLTVQPDGKILVGGAFFGPNSIGGQERNCLARIDPISGLVDGFDPNAFNEFGTSVVNSTAVLSDHKILATGTFTMIGGQPRQRMAQLDPDIGAPDSFNPNVGGDVLCSAIQSDGKILIGGVFTSVDGQMRNRIARIIPEASPGPTSSPGPSPSSTSSPTAPPVPTPSPTSSPMSSPGICNLPVQGFDDIATLAGSDWVQTNHSGTIGTTSWFQGTTSMFYSQSGAWNSYIAANYNNTTNTNTISNWLLTPPITLNNGSVLTFWTRTVDTPQFPDRLQVRMSTSGSSTNVGSTATSVGDFTTLLLDINPTYTTTGYPNVWVRYSLTVSGVPAQSIGRFAFRYFVENGGPFGFNSDYIGIDSVKYQNSAGCVTSTPGPTPAWLTLVSRLSYASASGSTQYNGGDNPPTQVQTDFSPAHLSNSASAIGESGGGTGNSTSNSSIAVDNSNGTVQISGDGTAGSGAILHNAHGGASADVIILNFTVTNPAYAYSLTGQLSASHFSNNPGTSDSTATAQLTSGATTIFQVVTNAPPDVTLSQSGILQPGNYTLSILANAAAQGGDFAGSGNSSSSVNFNFVLSPAATATPMPIFNIVGGISYCSNPAAVPVPNVILNLTGGASTSTLSDANGTYAFSSLAGGGTYTVTPSKTALSSGATGINTVDVIAVQRHFLGVTLLSGCRLNAADANGDANVTTIDVVAVQRFFLGVTTGIANVGKYQFAPTNRTYSSVGSDQTNQNYDALIFGDVATPFVSP